MQRTYQQVIEMVDAFFEAAKQNKIQHGDNFAPVARVVMPDDSKPDALMVIPMKDSAEKRQSFRKIKRGAELVGALGVVTILDTWTSEIKDAADSATVGELFKKKDWDAEDTRLYEEIKKRAVRKEGLVVMFNGRTMPSYARLTRYYKVQDGTYVFEDQPSQPDAMESEHFRDWQDARKNATPKQTM